MCKKCPNLNIAWWIFLKLLSSHPAQLTKYYQQPKSRNLSAPATQKYPPFWLVLPKISFSYVFVLNINEIIQDELLCEFRLILYAIKCADLRYCM